jgi:flagellar protein FlbD
MDGGWLDAVPRSINWIIFVENREALFENGALQMIRVSRLNKQPFLVNPDRIEFIEETPDTVLSFESGRKVVVAESADEIANAIVAYRQKVLHINQD